MTNKPVPPPFRPPRAAGSLARAAVQLEELLTSRAKNLAEVAGRKKTKHHLDMLNEYGVTSEKGKGTNHLNTLSMNML